MYFDPTLRTDAKPIETKADPFKLGTLIAWLEKQPADGRYNYVCDGHCLLAEYFTTEGFTNVVMGPWYFQHADGKRKLPEHFDLIAHGSVRDASRSDRWTYGAALDRARNSVRT